MSCKHKLGSCSSLYTLVDSRLPAWQHDDAEIVGSNLTRRNNLLRSNVFCKLIVSCVWHVQSRSQLNNEFSKTRGGVFAISHEIL